MHRESPDAPGTSPPHAQPLCQSLLPSSGPLPVMLIFSKTAEPFFVSGTPCVPHPSAPRRSEAVPTSTTFSRSPLPSAPPPHDKPRVARFKISVTSDPKEAFPPFFLLPIELSAAHSVYLSSTTPLFLTALALTYLPVTSIRSKDGPSSLHPQRRSRFSTPSLQTFPPACRSSVPFFSPDSSDPLPQSPSPDFEESNYF